MKNKKALICSGLILVVGIVVAGMIFFGGSKADETATQPTEITETAEPIETEPITEVEEATETEPTTEVEETTEVEPTTVVEETKPIGETVEPVEEEPVAEEVKEEPVAETKPVVKEETPKQEIPVVKEEPKQETPQAQAPQNTNKVIYAEDVFGDVPEQTPGNMVANPDAVYE